MATNYIQPGNTLMYTNIGTETVLSSDVVVVGSRIGVSKTNIEPGDSGAVEMTGVWALPKSSAALAQGDVVHWNGSQLVKTSTAETTPAGYVFESADASDDVVNVKIG